MIRVSFLFVFAPIFSSPAIAPRLKAGMALAITWLLAPVVVHAGATAPEIHVATVLSEAAAGIVLSLSLQLLSEGVQFAGALLGMQFSFSLVNLVDPNSKVETPVMGQLLNWMSTLILLAAGLHRVLLASLLRSFLTVPVGTFVVKAESGRALVGMAAAIFSSGVQLAAPVIAAAFVVEVTLGFLTRLSPQLPAMILSVPIKTMVSYAVLMGSLAVWPLFLEHEFATLLHGADRLFAMGAHP